MVALQNKKVSSANIRWVIGGDPLTTMIPWIELVSSAHHKNLERLLAIRMNRRGDKGSL